MDVRRHAEIDRARRAACGSLETARRCSLISAAQSLNRFGRLLTPSRKPDDQERQVWIAKLGAPVEHPRGQPAIIAGNAHVGFTLVPGDLEAERPQRCDHRIIDLRDARDARPWRHGSAGNAVVNPGILPPITEWEGRAANHFQLHFFGGSGKASRAIGVSDVDDDFIRAGMKDTRRDRVDALHCPVVRPPTGRR